MRINLLLPAMALLIAGSGWASDVFDMEPDWTYSITGMHSNLRIEAACLNEDAIPDLIVGNLFQEKLSVFFGNGDGSFYLAEEFLGYEAVWIESADVDNDGDIDVLIRFPEIEADSFAVFLNTGDGQFEDPICSQGQLSGQLDKFAVCNLNSDTFIDIVTASDIGLVYAMLGDGQGGFNTVLLFSDEDDTFIGLNCGDIDNDNDIDIVLICWQKLSVLLNNGDGSVTWNGYYGGFSNEAAFGSLDIGYLDSDNFPDIASAPGATMGENTVYSFLGDGLGAFSQTGPGWLDLGFPTTQTELNDFNLDGYNDAFFTGYSANLLMLGDGTGSLAFDYINYYLLYCYQTEVADLDLDGDIDFVTASDNIGSPFQIEVFLNKTISNGIEDSSSSVFAGSPTLEITENPVYGNSDVQISLPVSSNSSLFAYDIQGRRVAVLQEGFLAAGNHSLAWVTDDLSTGCYTLVLQTETESISCRCVLID
ncbi:MAG: VCBS repeat-containing protein [Candidatus Sabulitectum sp.]|nr:VCBS repeat-containing protein [Candidatus Sabulitectum sp.]